MSRAGIHGPTEQGDRACTCEEKSGGATANIYRTALKVSPMSPPISKEVHHTGPHFRWQCHREEGERKRRGKREGRKMNPDGGTPHVSDIFAIPENANLTITTTKKKNWSFKNFE